MRSCGTTYWETSPDGSEWIEQHQLPSMAAEQAMLLQFTYYAQSGSSGAFVFDDGETGIIWHMSLDGSSWGTAYTKADVGFPLDAVRIAMRAEAFGGVATAIRLESFNR